MSEADTLPPQKKRQRRNSNGDERTRSQYWFDDGNIVLQAENTLFRVHQSILSRHSQIFKDTFAMPQGPSLENDRIEGCPVIPLSDTAEDLVNIVSLLYDNDTILKFGNKLSARVLGSMLRLGRKYEITYFENEALARLHHDYPKTLKDWDSVTTNENSQQIERHDVELISTRETISIAHEFHLLTILPAAYARYLQCQHLMHLLDDDSIPKEAREHCVIGNTRILAYLKDRIVDALCPPLVLPSKTCSSGGKCEANRWNMIKNLPVWTTVETKSFGIYVVTEIKNPENLCTRCRTAVTKLTEKVRSEFWAMLPTFFDLPAWADLKDDP